MKIFATALFILAGLVTIVLWQELKFHDGKLHIVFCNVGQGDAIFIRTPNKTDILLDGGPDRKVLDCLSSHMPFWDRTLELVLLSHPHEDHFAGLIDVLERYTVLSFATEKLSNNSASFASFTKHLKENLVEPRYLLSGSRVKTGDGVELALLAPTKEFLAKTSPYGEIGESGEFGSLIVLITYGAFSALLTSDSQASQLTQATEALLSSVSLLQVPHHGSKTGLIEDIVDSLSPKVAIISVGKNNRYHHPNDEILRMLKDKKIKILRTDQIGEIEVVSDGKTGTYEVVLPGAGGGGVPLLSEK